MAVEKIETQGDPWASSITFVPKGHEPWTRCWASVAEDPLPITGEVHHHECTNHSKSALGLCEPCAAGLLP